MTFGHYVIGEVLGQGGMGAVYKARDTRLDRSVALKVLLPGVISSPEWRFIQEARTASALNHPNIVTIYEIDSIDGTAFITMELIEGRTLADLIAGEAFGLAEAISYAVQIADALAAAHAKGIVHRDLSRRTSW